MLERYLARISHQVATGASHSLRWRWREAASMRLRLPGKTILLSALLLLLAPGCGQEQDKGSTPETSVVVLTHDPKLDDPALKLALPSPAGYVGALGSPKTQAKRVKRLLAEGLAQHHIDRLRAPIGLNIGGRSPAEIALSIMAEIVAVRNGRSIANRK